MTSRTATFEAPKPVIPDSDLAEGDAGGAVAWRDSAHVEDCAEVVDSDVVEADLEEVGGELDESYVGPRRRLKDELLPRLDGTRLALQGVRRPVVDVELDELLHRDERVVVEQDGGGALQHAVCLGVIAHDLPELDAVRLGELDATEHVGEGVRAAVAHTSLVNADAAWPQALREIIIRGVAVRKPSGSRPPTDTRWTVSGH